MLFGPARQLNCSPVPAAVARCHRGSRWPQRFETREADLAPPAWRRDEMEQQQVLDDVEVRTYVVDTGHQEPAWLAYAASTSNLFILERLNVSAILADVAEVIDDAGLGPARAHCRCDLYLARRTAVAGVSRS